MDDPENNPVMVLLSDKIDKYRGYAKSNRMGYEGAYYEGAISALQDVQMHLGAWLKSEANHGKKEKE